MQAQKEVAGGEEGRKGVKLSVSATLTVGCSSVPMFQTDIWTQGSVGAQVHVCVLLRGGSDHCAIRAAQHLWCTPTLLMLGEG